MGRCLVGQHQLLLVSLLCKIETYSQNFLQPCRIIPAAALLTVKRETDAYYEHYQMNTPVYNGWETSLGPLYIDRQNATCFTPFETS